MPAETEVVVIDAPEGARALGGYLPRREHTHLVCRWPGEIASSFLLRVSECLVKARSKAEIVALTLVLGGESPLCELLPSLGPELAAALAPSGQLTLLGAGASQSEVVASFEALRQLLAPSVSVDAWFEAP